MITHKEIEKLDILFKVDGHRDEHSYMLVSPRGDQGYACLCIRYDGPISCMCPGDWTRASIYWYRTSGRLLAELGKEEFLSDCFESYKKFHKGVIRRLK